VFNGLCLSFIRVFGGTTKVNTFSSSGLRIIILCMLIINESVSGSAGVSFCTFCNLSKFWEFIYYSTFIVYGSMNKCTTIIDGLANFDVSIIPILLLKNKLSGALSALGPFENISSVFEFPDITISIFSL